MVVDRSDQRPSTTMNDSHPTEFRPDAQTRMSAELERCARECRHLRSAWRRSATTLERMRAALDAASVPGVHTAYVVGSLGRREQLTASDCDLIVVLDDEFEGRVHGTPRAAASRKPVLDAVWAALEPLGLQPPRSDGIYATPVTVGELLDPSVRGRVDEAFASFGARIQLLLEGRPVYRERAYRDLTRQILHWYGTSGPPHADGRHVGAPAVWQYLLHDLQRYYRSLCVRTQWIDAPQRWETVNIKLRHSRRLAYVGLLMLLGTSAAVSGDPETWARWFCERLDRTPLERVLAPGATPAGAPAGVRPRCTLVECYDRFLGLSEQVSRGLPDDAEARWRNASAFEETLEGVLCEELSNWPDVFRRQLLI